MALTSDITVNVSKFQASSILPATAAFNQHLMDATASGPKHSEVGIVKYRQMIHNGETSISKPILLDSASSFAISSRDAGRTIPCRILKPSSGAINGIYMHLHLGSWTVGDEISQDPMLQRIANTSNLLCISIGYRLAPEHPFPASPYDCFDAAEWLISNAEAEFNAPLSFIGGESAGAHLSVLTAIYLLKSEKYPDFKLKGLLLHFGVYDLSGLPQFYNFSPSRPLLINAEAVQPLIAGFCPGKSSAELKDHKMSPLYANLDGLPLPPALFTCGTQDMLLDDTVFMSVKWMMAGGEAVVKVYSGASHAYLGFPDVYPASKQVFEDVESFVKQNSRWSSWSFRS